MNEPDDDWEDEDDDDLWNGISDDFPPLDGREKERWMKILKNMRKRSRRARLNHLKRCKVDAEYKRESMSPF